MLLGTHIHYTRTHYVKSIRPKKKTHQGRAPWNEKLRSAHTACGEETLSSVSRHRPFENSYSRSPNSRLKKNTETKKKEKKTASGCHSKKAWGGDTAFLPTVCTFVALSPYGFQPACPWWLGINDKKTAARKKEGRGRVCEEVPNDD